MSKRWRNKLARQLDTLGNILFVLVLALAIGNGLVWPIPYAIGRAIAEREG